MSAAAIWRILTHLPGGFDLSSLKRLADLLSVLLREQFPNTLCLRRVLAGQVFEHPAHRIHKNEATVVLPQLLGVLPGFLLVLRIQISNLFLQSLIGPLERLDQFPAGV